jgi:hypothetical protein
VSASGVAPLAIYCKTFRDDIDHFARLAASVEAHNPERIPFVVSVPAGDRQVLLDRCGAGRFELVADEEYTAGPLTGNGWVDQQVVKLSAWRLRRAAALLMVDADFRFLRDVRHADLHAEAGYAATVLSHELHVWEDADPAVRAALAGTRALPRLAPEVVRAWGRSCRVPRARGVIERVRRRFRLDVAVHEWFGRSGAALVTMPGPVLSHAAQVSFHDEFLRPSRLAYADLLAAFPFEHTWVAEWTIARHADAVHPIPPTFLHFRTERGVAEARAAGVTRAAIARHYLGVALAARHHHLLDY